MLATLLSLIAAPLFAQDPSITMQARAGALKDLIPAIGEQAGLRMAAGGGVSEDVVFVHVKDMPLSVLMDRLAKATGNRWATEGQITRLVRDSSAETAARNEARAIFKAEFEKGLARPGGSPAFGVARAIGGTPVAETAIDKGFKALIGKLDKNKLADMEMGQRIVFATNPTSMQVGIAASVQTEANAIAQAAAAEKNRKPAEDGRLIRMMTPMNDGGTIDGDLSKGIGKVLVAVQRATEQVLDFQLIIADTQGKTLAVANQLVSLEDPMPASPTGLAPKYSPSADTKELASILFPNAQAQSQPVDVVEGQAIAIVAVEGTMAPLRFGGTDAPTPKLSASLKAKLHGLKDFPAARFGIEEALSGTFADQSIVAPLPEEALFGVLNGTARNNVGQVWTSILRHVTFTKDEQGWLGKPKFLLDYRKNRISGDAVSRALKDFEQNEFTSLNAAMNFVNSQSKAPNGAHIDGLLFNSLTPSGLLDQMSNGFSGMWHTVKLLASVTPIQRQTLSRGNPVALATLGPAALSVLKDDVFNSLAGPILEEAGGRPSRSITVTELAGGGGVFYGGFGMNLASERTQYLPNGIDGRGTITIRTNAQNAILASNSQTGAKQVFTAREYGMRQSFQVNGQPMESKFDKFKPLGAATYSLNYRLLPQVFMSRNLIDMWAITGSQTVAFDLLPDNIKREVEEGKSRTRGSSITIDRRSIPPPP